MEEEFAAAMRERANPLLASLPGVRSGNMGRSVENPDKFVLLVEWESMAAHDASRTTRTTDPSANSRPFLNGGSMEHSIWTRAR